MDASEIVEQVLAALRGEIGEGFGEIAGFAQRQAEMLAKHAKLIADQRIDGVLRDDDEYYRFWLDGLERDTLDLARNIAMLSILTIEKAWNAVAGVLWGAMRTILTAAGLPGPLLPAAPPRI